MVSIIIPTYNRAGYLLETLNSLLRQNYCNFETVVVDNGPSPEITRGIVKDLNDLRIKCITSKKGIYYAMTTGVKWSKGDILLFLDDDAEMITDDDLGQAVETFAENSSIGIVGCIEVKSKNDKIKKTSRLDQQVGKVSIKGSFNSGYKQIEGHGITEVDQVRSAFLAIRRKCYDTAGGLDALYVAGSRYFRCESDLCLSVKRAGYKVVVNPTIKIWHKGAPRKSGFDRGFGMDYFYYANRNHNYFMNKFFWYKNPFWNLYDLLVGAYRTPGAVWSVRRTRREKDLHYLVNLPASILGKLCGYYRSNKYL
jgi:glycosyltransferase involved in cell wall biosynthesis